MQGSEIKAAIEAVLFASGNSVPIERIAKVIGIEQEQLEEYLKLLMHEYQNQNRGIQLVKLENSYQLTTKKEYSQYVKNVLDSGRIYQLSPQALEVLAVIAYNQPVTKIYVEQVRGVDCTSSISNLCDKGLICEVGKLDAPGRPILYGTTNEFLRMFGLSSIDQLPKTDLDNQNTQDKDNLFTMGKE